MQISNNKSREKTSGINKNHEISNQSDHSVTVQKQQQVPFDTTTNTGGDDIAASAAFVVSTVNPNEQSITTASISSVASSSRRSSNAEDSQPNMIDDVDDTIIKTSTSATEVGNANQNNAEPPSFVDVPVNHATGTETENILSASTIEVKESVSVVSDPVNDSVDNNAIDNTPNQEDTPNEKPASHHKRRSNSDIPLSVQTGTFLQQQSQYYPWQHPQSMRNISTVGSLPQYHSNNSINNNMYWPQSQQPPHYMSTMQPPSTTNPIPNNMFYPYNPTVSHPLLQKTGPTPPTSPGKIKSTLPYNVPLSPQQYNQQLQLQLQQQQQQQAQLPNLPYYSNYQIPVHPSQQHPMYNPQMGGPSQAPMFYPYPPFATNTNMQGVRNPLNAPGGPIHRQQQQQTLPPLMVQKSASYAGDDSDRTRPSTTVASASENNASNERRPLLSSASSERIPTGQQHTVAANRNHPPRQQQQQQQQRRAPRHHRRSLSSSAAESGIVGPNNYGSFWNDDATATNDPQQLQQEPSIQAFSTLKNSTLPQPPPPPYQQQQQQQQPSVKFSPMAEFRKLQQGLSPTSSNALRKQQQQQSMSGMSSNPSSFRSNNNDMKVSSGSFSPSITNNKRLSASMREMNFYHSTQEHHEHAKHPHHHHHHRHLSYGGDGDRYQQQRTQQQQLSSQIITPSLGRRALLQKAESLRKMHARQQSAQLLVDDIKGVEQPLACRNVFFLLLFVFHILLMICIGQQYGPNALIYHPADTDAVTIVYSSLIYIAGWSGLFAVVISTLLLAAMTYFASHFVQIALFVMITLSFIWGTIGIGLSPRTTVPVTGIIALALAVAYTFIVWDRIPFASANLVTALTALRDFPGIVYVAFGFQIVALVYSIAYSILVFGVYNAMQDPTTLNISDQMTYVVYILLILSFSWTLQVIQSTVQAITAAVVYKWWHEGRSEQNGSLVKESCLKTIFYSMGSICFGSLVVPPVKFLRWIFVLFRPSSTETPSLMCLYECIHYIQSCVSYCVDSLAASCNSWSYTYIGMYHYGFLEGGSKATELFSKRGWSTIVSDDLVPNVLFLTSLVIGGVTGCFAYLLSELDRLAVVIPKDDPGLAPFVEGVIIGLVLPSVVFSLITSSVNAVLVCFASSPVDFERQHPELRHDMRAAWRDVWPRALHIDDAVAIRLVDQSTPFINPAYQVRAPSPYLEGGL